MWLKNELSRCLHHGLYVGFTCTALRNTFCTISGWYREDQFIVPWDQGLPDESVGSEQLAAENNHVQMLLCDCTEQHVLCMKSRLCHSLLPSIKFSLDGAHSTQQCSRPIRHGHIQRSARKESLCHIMSQHFLLAFISQHTFQLPSEAVCKRVALMVPLCVGGRRISSSEAPAGQSFFPRSCVLMRKQNLSIWKTKWVKITKNVFISQSVC